MIYKEKADYFTVAILKGTVEGDPHKHFGSTLGFTAHRLVAEQHELVEPVGEGGWTDLKATEKAKDLYDRHQLSELPEGRAYLAWQVWTPKVEAVLAELNTEESER